MRLDKFSSSEFDRGRSRLVQAAWLVISAFTVATWLPGSRWRGWLLSLFGARIGSGVVIKPNVRVKFPWRLSIGDFSWIGEDVWIDNLDLVEIGSHACVSQGAYLCTGSHDWSKETFDLITRPIRVGDHAWVGARAVLAPGTVLQKGGIVVLGGVASGSLDAWTVHHGIMSEGNKGTRRRVFFE